MIKNFGFNYRGKRVNLRVEECNNLFTQTRGLMFRRQSLPLLFSFNHSVNIPIHSFFCVPFYAIWFEKGEIVDEKLIFPRNFSICPSKKFDKLLEIPSNDFWFKTFTDERKV